MDNEFKGADVQVKRANPLKSLFPLIVIVASLVISFLVFYGVFGDPSNFEGGEVAVAELDAFNKLSPAEQEAFGDAPNPTKGHPLNFFGTIFKGGPVIPVAMTLFLLLFVFTIERFITLFLLAGGRGSVDVFVQKIRMFLHDKDFDSAIDQCDRQRGSVAAVVKAGLTKYKEVANDSSLDHEQKKVAIQTELEEATTLELPMLEKNLVIIATLASIGVLVGLFGTVVGMIKAFQALATSGSPDAAELSVGISEALVNTAIGIFTSMVSIIMYNFFTSKIDSLTYSIDEAGFSIVQTFEKSAH
jgi:biopolymer transport protein ExbB